jgi:hypothetical protein
MAVAAAMAAILAWGAPARAEPPKIAVFDFSFDNTSMEPTRPDELKRLQMVDNELREGLAKSGKYQVISTDTPDVRKQLSQIPSVRQCNGCEIPIAKKLGATLVAYGWIQKVSNLILNLNIVIEDVDTGKQIKNGSVDIRGNTDESWTRGLKYLLDEHVFNDSRR